MKTVFISSGDQLRPALPLHGSLTTGFALVLVLAMLVLVAGLVTAYFSKALQERRTGQTSASERETMFFTQSATQLVLGDLVFEMEAGSEPDPWADDLGDGGIRIFRPLPLEPLDNEDFMLAPSLFPQRAGGPDDVPVILKVSRRGTPFFEAFEGDTSAADGPERATAIGTDVVSSNGHVIRRESWNLPRLMTTAEFAAFQSPDWIYVDRAGNNPAEFTPQTLTSMRSPENGNPDYVLGRYAYVVYDVGGLIDVNTVDNTLSHADAGEEWDNLAGRRGRLHQVSLEEGIGGVALPGFDRFVGEWRWPVTGTSEEILFDSTNRFLEVAVGEQALVGRRELIRYAQQAGSEIPMEVLPYLTVFNRDLNAPLWQPNPWREVEEIPDPWEEETIDPEEINSSLLEARFSEETTLSRGNDPEVTVPAGTPVMPRRFPLGKLDLFEQPNPDPDSLRYYFGVEKVSGRVATYDYTETVDGRIARLPEVAALGREPNFFEILQAVIYTGSLGRHGRNTNTFDWMRDRLRNLQVMQIGANIIDQWDADDIPTTIRFPSGDDEEPPLEVYGVENLPYFHQFLQTPFRPSYDRDLLQWWIIFDVWNPHQNALSAPEDIAEFRIIPTGGTSRARAEYWLRPEGQSLGREESFAVDVEHGPRWWPRSGDARGNVLLINEDRELSFPVVAGGYAEPTTIGGGEPMEQADTPGLLVGEYDLSETPRAPIRDRPTNANIPEKSLRHPDLQVVINELWDRNSHTTYESSNTHETNADGDRVYPPDTVFWGAGADGDGRLNPDYWSQTDEVDRTVVYGRFGVKGFNYTRHRPDDSHPRYDNLTDSDMRQWVPPDNPLNFALQARVGGEWITYQRIDNWFRWSGGMVPGAERQSNLSQIEGILGDTHHSVVPDDQLERDWFYTWWRDWEDPDNRFGNDLIGMGQKVDPRSMRFGFGAIHSRDRMGQPIRSTMGPWNRLMWSGGWAPQHGGSGFIPGRDTNNNPIAGFEFFDDRDRAAVAGLVTNNPDLPQGELNGYHPMRYSGRDGVIRPGDAYFGWDATPTNTSRPDWSEDLVNLPTAPGRYRERPVILNRPFRSVGELGYASRDEPWKTLDFSSRFSADLGLLDVFSLEETPGETPLVAGKVNLNSARPEVLQLLLRDSTEQLSGVHPQVPGSRLSNEEASELATLLVEESQWSPFVSRGDIVPRVMHTMEEGPVWENKVVKAHREAAVRTLAELGGTRTWNLMIDLVAQTGRFTVASQDGGDFLVQGEKRIWLHVALDRLTGEILDMTVETIYD